VSLRTAEYYKMAAEARSVLVAFTGLMTGAIFVAFSLLEGAGGAAAFGLALAVFSGAEFLRCADFDALS
jgi:hypothetical protein